MLQQDKPDDFVIATVMQYSVRDFIKWSSLELGIISRFEGCGLNDVAIIEKIEGTNASSLKVGDVNVKIDQNYSPPTEVKILLGDPTEAKTKLC